MSDLYVSQITVSSGTYKIRDSEFTSYTNNIYDVSLVCVGDGTTDDTEALTTLIQKMQPNDVLYSPANKTYLISSAIDISGLNIIFNNSTIKFNSNNATISINYTDSIIKISDLKIDVNNFNNYAVNIIDGQHLYITNMNILNIINTAITIASGYEIIFNYLNIQGTALSSNSVGIELYTSDCHFTDILMKEVHTAFHIYHASAYITRAHCWSTISSIVKNSIFIRITQTDATNIMVTDCYCDTYQTMFMLDSYTGVSSVSPFIKAVNCLFALNSVYYSPSLGMENPLILSVPNQFDTTRTSFINCHFNASNNYNDIPFSNVQYLGRQIGTNYIFFTESPAYAEVNLTHQCITNVYTNQLVRNNNIVTLNLVFEYDSSKVNSATTTLGTIPYQFFNEGGTAYNGICAISDDRYGDTKQRNTYYLYANQNLQISVPVSTGQKYCFINVSWIIDP